MSDIRILWADDEIDLLKPQLKFLEKRGYKVETVANGHDALDAVKEDNFDVIFLDESMPGLTGLETLTRIKNEKPYVPVVMITKNEAEDIMEQAIGSQISDYLIKPVNPNQILLSLKKIIDNKRLTQERIDRDYQMEFRNIMMEINSHLDLDEWVDIYKKIINWEIKLEKSTSEQMQDILRMQKKDANAAWFKFVERNYLDWINADEPVMSHTLMRNKVLPHINEEKPTVMLLLDNLRYDQYKVLESHIQELFTKEEEDYFISILPTSTQYSRNAIWAGILPGEIAKHHREYWLHDYEEGGKNNFEEELLNLQVQRLIRRPIRTSYQKITKVEAAKDLQENILNVMNYDLSVIVYNFIDMLSHARTEMEVLKELAGDEIAYRSLTVSWFLHSPLYSALQKLSERDINLIITTDHGTIRVQTPSQVVADKSTTTNLRYKLGKNLNYDRNDVLEVRKPENAGLPTPNVSSAYIFAKEDVYFLYPNNYSYYNNYFRDTFQHGGVSLEEMVCPFAVFSSK